MEQFSLLPFRRTGSGVDRSDRARGDEGTTCFAEGVNLLSRLLGSPHPSKTAKGGATSVKGWASRPKTALEWATHQLKYLKGELMSRATYPLKLPLSIKKAAQRLAKEDGVSLNQWIAAAVAEKVGVVETAAEFFKKRAGEADGSGLMKFLRTAPKSAPEPEDRVR